LTAGPAALATDYIPAPAPMLAPQPADYDWTGFFVQATAAPTWNELKTNDPSHFNTTGGFDLDETVFSLGGGYRHQFFNNIVLGASIVFPVGSVGGSSVDTTFFPNRVFYEADVNSAWLANLILGYAMDRWLAYGSIGWGSADVTGRTLNVNSAGALTPGAVQETNATHDLTGYALGFRYAWTDSVIVGATWFRGEAESEDHTVPWNAPGPNLFGLDAEGVAFTVEYKFGPGGLFGIW
jgi:hypothetical protein